MKKSPGKSRRDWNMRKPTYSEEQKNKHIVQGVFVFLFYSYLNSLFYSDLCTHACPYRLARLGTSLRVRGKLTLRKKEIIVFKFIYAFNDYPMPDSSLRVKLCFSFVIIPILLAAQEWWQRCFCLPWYSVLCTHTCPFRLARLGTSLRVRGKLTLRKKEFIVFKYITWLLP